MNDFSNQTPIDLKSTHPNLPIKRLCYV